MKLNSEAGPDRSNPIPLLSLLAALICVAAGPTTATDRPAPPTDNTVTLWPDLSAAIDALFAPYDQPFHPGGVTAVLFEGELIHLKGYGAANREFNVPWTADTRYRIASMGKSMMGNLFLKLQDQGMLNLDDPVRQHLPEFPDYGTPLTLRHLLSMNSGLWQDEHIMIIAGAATTGSHDSMYQLSIKQRKLDYVPGSYERSADVNFRVLARILEELTGKPYF